MSYFSVFSISFAIALSGALAPGPLLALVISESFHRGFKTGPLVILGHALLEMILIGLLLLGFSKIIHRPLIIHFISLIGAVILCFFGWQMLRSAPSAVLPVNEQTKMPSRSSARLVFLGLTVSLVNPYWSIWWLTIGLGLLISASGRGWLSVGVFFLGHILADFLWYSLVSLAIFRGRKIFSDRAYRLVIGACGLSLIFFGIYFLSTLII